jgi:hypothetical protein
MTLEINLAANESLLEISSRLLQDMYPSCNLIQAAMALLVFQKKA